MPRVLVGSLSLAGGVIFLRSTEFDSQTHPAPRRQWVVMLRGAMEIEVTDGTRRRFGPGDVVLGADATGRGHVTVAVGNPPLEAIAIPEA